MNTQNILTSQEKNMHKVLFKPQGLLAFVTSILPNDAILKFDQSGNYACACFNNLIDYNEFKTKLSIVSTL